MSTLEPGTEVAHQMRLMNKVCPPSPAPEQRESISSDMSLIAESNPSSCLEIHLQPNVLSDVIKTKERVISFTSRDQAWPPRTCDDSWL